MLNRSLIMDKNKIAKILEDSKPTNLTKYNFWLEIVQDFAWGLFGGDDNKRADFYKSYGTTNTEWSALS